MTGVVLVILATTLLLTLKEKWEDGSLKEVMANAGKDHL